MPLRINANTSFVRTLPLDDPDVVNFPPAADRKILYFLPVYLDESRCCLKRETVDHCPTEKNLVMREPCHEGTAYVVGQYGAWWSLDADRATAPIEGPRFTLTAEEYARELARAEREPPDTEQAEREELLAQIKGETA